MKKIIILAALFLAAAVSVQAQTNKSSTDYRSVFNNLEENLGTIEQVTVKHHEGAKTYLASFDAERITDRKVLLSYHLGTSVTGINGTAMITYLKGSSFEAVLKNNNSRSIVLSGSYDEKAERLTLKGVDENQNPVTLVLSLGKNNSFVLDMKLNTEQYF